MAAFRKLSEGGSRLRSMGKGRRVRAARSGLPARHVTCGCPSLGRIAYRLSCPTCGGESSREVVLPTSGRPGDFREVFSSCDECGGDAEGQGVIVELLGSHGL
jgi:hypothetical protein